MATLLYRLGKASFDNAWRVLIIWLVAFVAIGGGGIALGGATDEQFDIPGSPSRAAFDRLASVFPGFGTASAQAVIVAPEGQRLDSPDNTAAIEELAAAIAADEIIDDTISPFDEFAGRALSDDGRYALLQVQFAVSDDDITDEMLDTLVSYRSVFSDSDLIVEFGGNLFQDQGVHLTIAEVFGVAFAGLVLIVTFRSFRPAWAPLASAVVGVGISIGLILMAAGATVVSSSAPLLAVMLGLAVGIDYSLFILQRHRTQLATGLGARASAAIAVGTAGNAVVFAGVTVVIALLGLFVVGIPFLSVMGASAAAAVVVAIAAAITLLPALMGLMGEKLRPLPGSKAHQLASMSAATPSMGRRWVRFVMKKPLIVTLVSIAGLATLAIPALELDLNLPSGASEPRDSTQRKAFDYVSEGFGPGYNGPLVIAVDITRTDEIIETLEGLRVDLAAVPGVDYVSEGFPSPTIDTGLFQAIPTSGPDSRETKELVTLMRESFPEMEAKWNVDLAVTGVTAIGVDVSQRIQSALIPFGLVVVGLSFLLLLVVFRSLLVPLKAALGFILSVTAAFGVVVAVFQWGWGSSLVGVDTPGPILSFMPIILMAVLFGLAMDYQVFLVSGMRESFVHSGQWRTSIEEGYTQGARVVVAAALIMFFVFFAFVPEGIALIKPIALGLAIGIALDAFVVRMTLVPAIMTLFGKAAWYLPAWVDRILPQADVEGEKLREHLAEVEWASAHSGDALTAEGLVFADTPADQQEAHWSIERGARSELHGSASSSAVVTGTLSGLLPQASGSLQVLGHALPSEASAVARKVLLVDSRPESGLVTVVEAVSQALPAATKAVRAAQVSRIISGVKSLSAPSAPRGGMAPLTPHTLPALLDAEQRILLQAAFAVLSGAPVCIIGGGSPIAYDHDAALWWRGLNFFASSSQTILLWREGTPSSTPAPPAATSFADSRAGGGA
jgi:RND superfamily putative drug exporter